MILELGPHRFDVTHGARVMGMLNHTPASFHKAGSYRESTGSGTDATREAMGRPAPGRS